MKKLLRLSKKLLIFALLLVMQTPLLGYKWQIYNATGKKETITIVASGQKISHTIPKGCSALYDFNTWNGILWMGGLCLTNIYVEPGERAALRAVEKTAIEGFAVTAGIALVIGTSAGAAIVGLPVAAVVTLIGGLATSFAILGKLCRDDTYVLARDNKGTLYAVTLKEGENPQVVGEPINPTEKPYAFQINNKVMGQGYPEIDVTLTFENGEVKKVKVPPGNQRIVTGMNACLTKIDAKLSMGTAIQPWTIDPLSVVKLPACQSTTIDIKGGGMMGGQISLSPYIRHQPLACPVQ